MSQLGKYEIIEEIGRGGFGVVYKARDRSLDRLVALKVLHPPLAVDKRFVENFKREARSLAKVEHPKVVNVYEIDEVAGRLFIAMRYLPGGSLADRIAQGPLGKKEVMSILQQVAEGLDAGHKLGIIHRDVKPSNILFDKDGNAVVADFGVARAVHVSTIGTTSVSGGMVGTPYYRPPELWRGSPPPSPATDVYSLACVLYEMVTGKVLFYGETPDSVLTRHVLDEAGLLIEEGGINLPSSLVGILKKALAKAPEDRYQNVMRFLDALKKPPQVNREVSRPGDVIPPVHLSGARAKTGFKGDPQSNPLPTKGESISSKPKRGSRLPKWAIYGSLGVVAVCILTSIIIFVLPYLMLPFMPEDEALGTETSPLVWALVPSGDSDDVLAGFDAVADIIYDETGLVIDPFVATEYAGVIEVLSADPPIAHISSLATFAYLVASERGAAEAELVSVRYGSPSYTGQIFVRSDSGIDSLEDLAGKVFCRPDPLSTSGWIIPSIEMLAAGVNPETDLAEVVDAGSHDAAVSGVYHGDCDAGSSFVDARSYLEEDYPDIMDVVEVIHTSVEIPNDGVQYHPSVSENLRQQINQALISMIETEEGREALDAAFEWRELMIISDDFYDPFRDVLDAAGLDVENFSTQ